LRFDHRARLERVKARMATIGLDVLLVPSPENMFYLAGCDGWSFYLHQLLMLHRERAAPIWIGRSVDRAAAARSPVLDAASIRPYGDDCIQSDQRHPYDAVAEEIESAGWSGAVVGLPMDAYYVSPRAVDTLRRRLPNARIVDDRNLVNWLRLIKDPDELVCMRQAADITKAAFSRAVPTVRIGGRHCDTAAEILHTQAAPSPTSSGELPAIAPLIISGDGPAMPHTTWSDAEYRSGQSFILEFSGSFRHYHCPIARTVSIGAPDAVRIRAARAISCALERAAKAAVPGARCEDIAKACLSEIRQHGFERSGRVGYSTGLGFPPDWGEHTLSLRAGDRTEVQAGMTIFMIPALWGDLWSVGIGETILVTEHGGISLTDIGFDLIVND
jgi:ectoine hydrolase